MKKLLVFSLVILFSSGLSFGQKNLGAFKEVPKYTKTITQVRQNPVDGNFAIARTNRNTQKIKTYFSNSVVKKSIKSFNWPSNVGSSFIETLTEGENSILWINRGNGTEKVHSLQTSDYWLVILPLNNLIAEDYSSASGLMMGFKATFKVEGTATLLIDREDSSLVFCTADECGNPFVPAFLQIVDPDVGDTIKVKGDPYPVHDTLYVEPEHKHKPRTRVNYEGVSVGFQWISATKKSVNTISADSVSNGYTIEIATNKSLTGTNGTVNYGVRFGWDGTAPNKYTVYINVNGEDQQVLGLADLFLDVAKPYTLTVIIDGKEYVRTFTPAEMQRHESWNISHKVETKAEEKIPVKKDYNFFVLDAGPTFLMNNWLRFGAGLFGGTNFQSDNFGGLFVLVGYKPNESFNKINLKLYIPVVGSKDSFKPFGLGLEVGSLDVKFGRKSITQVSAQVSYFKGTYDSNVAFGVNFSF